MTPIRASIMSSLLIGLTACTQPLAEVELKGINSYAKNNANGYVSPKSAPAFASNSQSSYTPPPVYTNTTVTTAGVQSIGVSDLPPPVKTESRKSISVASNDTVQKSSSIQKVNPWTNKPRAINSHDSLSISPAKTASATSGGGFMWPVNSHKIVSSFGPKGGGKVNDGINIASAEGEPVWAAADGEVIYVGNELQGYGNMILVRHAGNKNTTYANLSRTNVDKYDRVKQGDIIGYVGSTGNVKTPQLHFAIREGKDPLDPTKYLSRNLASN